jgi:subtilisin family serine protease
VPALAIQATTAAAAPPIVPTGPPPAIKHLIVGFKKNVSSKAQKRLISRLGGKRLKQLASIRAHVIRPRSGSLDRLRKRLEQSRFVRYAEPDFQVGLLATPTDPLFPSQYSETTAPINTQTTDAWNTKSNCSKVAILDTGIDTDHPDLVDNLWHNSKEVPNNDKDDDKNGYVDDYYGIDLIAGKGDGEDNNGHGTHVSGIVAGRANNGQGISGVCWSGSLVAVKFMDSQGHGSLSNAVAGIEYAIKVGAKIINNSWGGSDGSQALKDEIQTAEDKGILLTVAAGNNSQNIDKTPFYPASYTYGNLLVVAASTDADGLASFSDYGSKNVDLAAPGDSIISTYLGGGYKVLSGTSMATPFVTGVAALLKARNSDASYSTIRKTIRDEVDLLPAFSGITVSGGRVNTNKALTKIGS